MRAGTSGIDLPDSLWRELEIPLSSHSADRSTEVTMDFVCMVIFFDALSRSA